MKKVVFVDCFGTILFRTSPPEKTKCMLAKKLSAIYNIDFSLLYRSILSAEMKARIRNERKLEVRECTLQEIANNCLYSLINNSLLTSDLEKTFIDDFLNIYFSVENEVTFVNQQLKKKLNKYKKDGSTIVLLSNFYCGKDFFVQLFKNKGIAEIFDYYFVSCDHMALKNNGALFLIAMQQLGNVSPKEIMMFGNSNHSDIEPAKNLGISTCKISSEDKYFDNSKIVGGNIENPHVPKELNKLFFSQKYKYVFSNYAFPLLCFIEKLYGNLKEQNAKDVFFLSREGEFIKKLFDLYISIQEYKPRTHYLLASRNSLYGAILQPFQSETFEYIFLSKKNPKIFDFLVTIGFSDEEIEIIFKEIAIKDRDQVLSENSLSSAKQLLGKSKFFLYHYEENRKKQNKALRKYLDGFNIDFMSNTLFLVDVGWKGAMQDFIYLFFEQKIKIQGYYIGYRGQHGINSIKNQKHGLLWSNMPFSPTVIDKIFGFRLLTYEQILRASHNSVSKYDLNDGIVLNDTVNDNEVYTTLAKPMQNEIYNKFSEIVNKRIKIKPDHFAVLYAKMFAFLSPNDWIWLQRISNTHYDFFAKIGNFSELKISWKAYVRYRLGGLRLYFFTIAKFNKKINRYLQ